ncbi:protein Cep78 homolog isoform X2 [Vespa mandarinia]|uniref:protein Cep78 homolog isoform X2 n=1 Tax=Vespa mandarinia TaxID=7446 RepID=UPI00161507C6|nr:protein Cep78 homolog isoform X2 [Vespa mandarinia]
MQDQEETNEGERFEQVYKVLCHERCLKHLPTVESYLREKHLRLCADRVRLEEWSPIIGSIARNRDLVEILIYSRSRRRKVREKINNEEKLETLWRYRAKEQQQQPILYTNFLLRCLLNSIMICTRESSALKSLILDGIPLSPKYLRILCDGFVNNITLENLSLPKCSIGDTGCDMLLNALQDVPNLKTLNLSACCLTSRSVGSLSLYLKKRNANISENVCKDLNVEERRKKNYGLRTLVLSKNNKLNDNGIRRLMNVLKNDFWLKILGLRHCGITKIGAEIIFEVLRTNGVLTTIDLRENDIPSEILRSITKILKEKKGEKEEWISTRKKSDRRYERDGTFREKRSNRTNTARRVFIDRKTTENFTVSSREMKDSDEYEFEVEQDLFDFDNLDKFEESKLNLQDLQLRLSNLVSSNEALEKEIKKKGISLEEEKNRRIEAEQTCEKIKSLLERFKDKLIVQSWTRSEEDSGDNQPFDGLQGVLRILEGFSTADGRVERRSPCLRSSPFPRE